MISWRIMLNSRKLLILYFFLTMFFCSCSTTDPFESTKSDFPQGPLLHKFKKSQALLLSGQYNMNCCMEGGSSTRQVKKISLGFQINRRLSRDEGRAIVIDCVNQIIKNVRASQDLKPYLLPEGFNENSIKVVLFVNTNNEPYDPEISVFSYSSGRIRFGTYIENQTTPGYFRKYYEPYAEAVAILEEQGRYDIILPKDNVDLKLESHEASKLEK